MATVVIGVWGPGMVCLRLALAFWLRAVVWICAAYSKDTKESAFWSPRLYSILCGISCYWHQDPLSFLRLLHFSGVHRGQEGFCIEHKRSHRYCYTPI